MPLGRLTVVRMGFMARVTKKELAKRRKRLDARRPEPQPLWDKNAARTQCLCGHAVVFDKVESESQISGVCIKCDAKSILNLNQQSQWVDYDPVSVPRP